MHSASGVQQVSVLGPLLFTVYASPMADAITVHGVQYHQFAGYMQLHPALRSSDNRNGVAKLASCTVAVQPRKNAVKRFNCLLVGTGYGLD